MSRVVVIRLSGGDLSGALAKDQYRTMLDSGLKKLSDSPDTAAAAKKLGLFGKLAIKTNCLARKFNSTPVALYAALAEILLQSGFPPQNILAWDRTNQELEWAGFKLNATSSGPRCFGTDTAGFGYSSEFHSSGPVNSLVSRILTDYADSNVNLPVLKDHSIAGLSAGLKNMYGAINNPNKYHADNCNPFVAHVSALPPLRDKNRLSIIDAARIQYQGGPGYDTRYLASYGSLILSSDPVAADRVALEILEHLRAVNGLPSLEKAGRPVNYLKTAEEIGLGVADMKKIDLRIYRIDRSGAFSAGSLF